MNRSFRVVLMSHRSPEEGHDRVSDVLVDAATVFHDHVVDSIPE